MSNVVDASVVVEMLLGNVDAPVGELHAPDVMEVEVLSVMRRLTMRKRIPASQARDSLVPLAEFATVRHDARPLLPRMWAMRHDISTYDASYVALAEALGIPLMTADHRLAAVARRYCKVVVL